MLELAEAVLFERHGAHVEIGLCTDEIFDG